MEPPQQQVEEAPLPKGPLRKALQKILLNKVIRSVPTSESNLKALIVDRAALRILSSAMNTNELINYGVSVIELIDIRREPLPSIPAVYLLTPTVETVEQLCDENPRHYRSFRIFFTTHVPDFLMDSFKRKARFLKNVKAFVELNIRFLSLESRLFSLDRPAASLPQVHALDFKAEKMREEISSISDRLAEVCSLIAPSVSWNVRYDGLSFTARTLGTLVSDELSEIQRKRRNKKQDSEHAADDADTDDDDDIWSDRNVNENGLGGPTLNGDNDYEGSTMWHQTKPKKATLLVVDRASDLVTPLVHEFTYQAMAHDLLPLNYRKPGGAHLEVEEGGEKKFIRMDDEDTDPIWTTIRPMFIQEALQKAQTTFTDFVDNDPAYRMLIADKNKVQIKDMSAAVRALPLSRIKADKYALHIQASRACLERVEQTDLIPLSLLEQDLIVGRAPDGSKLKSEIVIERLVEALKDPKFPFADRVRLFLIAMIVGHGLPGLGSEGSILSSSKGFCERMKHHAKVDRLLPGLSSELRASVEGVVRLLTIAADGHNRFMLRTKPALVMDGNGGDVSLTSKFKYRYAKEKEQRRLKKDRRLRRERHGLTQDEMHYDVARYNPPLRSVMMDLVDEELDENIFPTTAELSVEAIISSLGGVNHAQDGDRDEERRGISEDPPSSSSSSSRLILRGNRDSLGSSSLSSRESISSLHERTADPDHLFVVFVVGGVSYSEVRAMYEVCSKRCANVIIGGSDILTPSSFIRQLAAVADPVIRLQVMLPPLPLELAITRANQKKNRPIESYTPSVAQTGQDRGEEQKDPENMDEEFHRERMNGEVVEVVMPYKKKGLKLFGKRRR